MHYPDMIKSDLFHAEMQNAKHDAALRHISAANMKDRTARRDSSLHRKQIETYEKNIVRMKRENAVKYSDFEQKHTLQMNLLREDFSKQLAKAEAAANAANIVVQSVTQFPSQVTSCISQVARYVGQVTQWCSQVAQHTFDLVPTQILSRTYQPKSRASPQGGLKEILRM